MKPVSCLLLLMLSVSSVLGCDESQVNTCTSSFSAAQTEKNRENYCRILQNYVNCMNRACSNALSQELLDGITNLMKSAGFECDLQGVNADDSSSSVAGRLGSSSLVLMTTALFLSIGFLCG